jgi:hypothetical protein
MSPSIPAPVLRADAALYAILERVAFSRYLNPNNAPQARLEFQAGAEAPPFTYEPLDQAEEILQKLDDTDPPRSHPAGALVGDCFDGARRLVRALRDRTPEAFHEMNEAAGWYPTEDLLSQAHPTSEPPAEPMDVDSETMIAYLEEAIVLRELTGWKVEADPVMAARVLVDGAKRILRVRPAARFRARDLERLVVHELDVHATRSMNGRAQTLKCFATGLPGSLATEEGLAMVAEEVSGTSIPGVLARQLEVVRAIDHARTAGFREVYQAIEERVGPGLAWGVCLRIKRGLADPQLPGVYAKDSVYLDGRTRVRAWLDAGGDISQLYVGKVGLHHPVDQWLEDGWVRPQPVPSLWAA